MRVHADRQTLILAGEPLPRRSAAGATAASVRGTSTAQRASYFNARFNTVTDADVTDAEYAPSATESDTSVVAYDASDVSNVSNDAAPPATTLRTPVSTSRAYSTYASSSRASAFGGASAYARTQDLSERHPIIDTYA